MRETAKNRALNQFIFVVPSIVFFSVFVIIPFLFSLGTSFSQWNGVSNDFRWAGISNYIRAFGDEDFKSSLIYTLKNTVVVTLLANGIGLLLALALTSKIRGIAFFRRALIVPNILSGIVLGFIWKFIFMKGLPAAGAALGSELLQISWLGRPGAAFWSIVIVSVWQMSGYVMLIYIAGILSVPADIIESAYLDGASNFQLIRCVILPHLKPSFLICFFWTISKNLVQFDLPFSLTGGGPYKSTETLAINIYQEAFVNNNYGYGASVVVILCVAVYLIPFFFMLMNSFKSNSELLVDVLSLPQKLNFENYVRAYQQLDYLKVFRNSLIITVFGNLGVILLSAMCAYRLERCPLKFNRVFAAVLLVGLIIPFQVIMIPLVKVLQTLHLINTLAGVVLTYWGMALPFTVFLFRGFIQGIPKEIEEAAVVDGCSQLQVFWRVTFPLLKPIVFTAITVNTFWFWNDFLLPQLIISDKALQTIPIAVNSFFGQYVMQWDLALPALVMAVIPAVIVFIVFQKYVVAGIANGAVYGLPLYLESYGFLYNKDYFEQAGITEVPTTITALKNVIEKLEAAGIPAFSVNGAEWYPNGLFLANVPFASQEDPDAFLAGINDGSLTFAEDPLYQDWTELVGLMRNHAVTDPLNTDFGTVVADFASGKVAMIMGVNGYQPTIDEINPEMNVGIMPMPVNADAALNDKIYVSASTYWCVNKDAGDEVKAAAKEFLNWLVTSETGQRYVTESFGFIPGLDTMEASQEAVGNIGVETLSYIKAGKVAPWAWTKYPDGVTTEFGGLVQKFYAGEIDGNGMLEGFLTSWNNLK